MSQAQRWSPSTDILWRERAAHLAIGISRMASMVGGVVGILLTIAIIQPLSNIAVNFGPAEMSIIVLIAIVACSTLIGESVLKGLTAGALGMLISLTGVGPVTLKPRLTFGLLELNGGMPLIPAVIGMFAVSQLVLLSLQCRAQPDQDSSSAPPESGRRSDRQGVWPSVQRLLGFGDLGELLEGIRITLHRRFLVLWSSVLGVLLGCIPGMGHSVAGFLAYGNAKSRSKDPDSFGRGNPAGIIAPEACDNGVTAGVLVPVLTLGIPGNATTAVLLGALYLNGVQVGPLLLQQHTSLAYAMLLAVLAASILILPLGILLAGPLIRLTRIRVDLLIPVALVLSVFGAFSSDNTLVDIGVMVAFGLLAILLRSCGYPIIPLLLGFVLGPIMEPSFVEALDLGQGHVSIFWQSDESKILLAGLVVLLVAAVWRRSAAARRTREAIKVRLRDAGSSE